MSVKEVFQGVISNPKIASSVSAATTTTGLGTILEWVPNDIGKLATLVGIMLSLVLIYTHLRRGQIEYQKTKLEMTILMQREAERIESASKQGNSDG